jgi:hypothetical protein
MDSWPHSKQFDAVMLMLPMTVECGGPSAVTLQPPAGDALGAVKCGKIRSGQKWMKDFTVLVWSFSFLV